MLRHILGPDFTEANWTSELRGQLPGFPPYSGPSIADFCYADRKGILTNLWCGQEQKKAWKHCWPTFHVEVKTTSSVANEPFHMSAAQLNMVRTSISSACLLTSDHGIWTRREDSTSPRGRIGLLGMCM